MKIRFTVAMLLISLFCASLPIRVGAKKHLHRRWSVDLAGYGYSTSATGPATFRYAKTTVAASNKVVALAIAIGEGNAASTTFANLPWQLSLLIFDADNGKLRAKCGPWSSRSSFDLWSTSSGNFLLYLEPSSDDRDKSGGHVLLLAPSCQLLQVLQLSDRRSVDWFLLSPSERSFLIERPSERGTEYELRDADTLAMRTKWIKIDRDDPQVVSVSDDGLLGVRPVNSKPSAFSPVRIFYRSFSAQQWREIPDRNSYQSATFISSQTTFISNQAFLETATIGNSAPCATSTVSMRVRTIDGATDSPIVVSRGGYRIGVSPFSVSPSGNYFGGVLGFTNMGWFWCKFDMGGPEHDKAYIWSSSSAKPIARISLGLSSSLTQSLAFAPDGSWFAIADRNTLNVRPLVPSPDAGPKTPHP